MGKRQIDHTYYIIEGMLGYSKPEPPIIPCYVFKVIHNIRVRTDRTGHYDITNRVEYNIVGSASIRHNT